MLSVWIEGLSSFKYHKEFFPSSEPVKHRLMINADYRQATSEKLELGEKLFVHFSDKNRFNKTVQAFNTAEKNLIDSSRGTDYTLFSEKLKKYSVALDVISCQDLVRDHLFSLILKKSNKKTAEELIDKLNLPLQPNFHKQEEYDLITSGNLEEHVAKYNWMLSRYGVIEEYSVEKATAEKETMDKGEVLAKWNHLQKTTQEAIDKAKEILGNEDSHFVDLIQWLVWFRTQRTDIIAKATYLFLDGYKKLAKSLGLTYDDLLWVTTKEVSGDSIPSSEEISKRKQGFTFYFSDGKQGILSGEEHQIAVKYMTLDISGVKELGGEIAYKGFATGTVRSIMDKEDFVQVEEGDIIVTSMTTPVMIPIMKKAAAFVTDEGGITCHAAVIAREMKKPCIIGTQHATQVLKDGDTVEVDADNGVVKIISDHE